MCTILGSGWFWQTAVKTMNTFPPQTPRPGDVARWSNFRDVPKWRFEGDPTRRRRCVPLPCHGGGSNNSDRRHWALPVQWRPDRAAQPGWLQGDSLSQWDDQKDLLRWNWRGVLRRWDSEENPATKVTQVTRHRGKSHTASCKFVQEDRGFNKVTFVSRGEKAEQFSSFVLTAAVWCCCLSWSPTTKGH